ncbi:hypothetical protein PR048_001977 [Dryococelus australis]|uniref:Peptidase aspartic putative domain-containing protein n=1 Tax=Dryococelus australis TaxID=614101 RepID=A0ABQ9ILE5_9NEOP|nr:hypothetical protein PR048_001977 [Dryococelus australis]
MLRKLLDNVVECTRLLKPVEHWNSILVFLVTYKLDIEPKKQWQLSLTSGEWPTFAQLTQLYEHHTRALQEQDPYHKCPDFASASVEERCTFVKDCGLCFNCLVAGHAGRQCTSSRCRLCHRYHHTFLHCNDNTHHHPQDRVEIEVNNHHARLVALSQSLLTSAIVNIQDSKTLLDSGSEASFVSENCVQKLRLRKEYLWITISGLTSKTVGQNVSMVHLNIRPMFSEGLSYTVKALVLPKLTGLLPKEPIKPKNNLMHFEGSYVPPGHIDVLLGANICQFLLRPGHRTGTEGSPMAIETAFGWVLSRPIDTSSRNQRQLCYTYSSMFWELEEIKSVNMLIDEEVFCEHHFKTTCERDESSRYVVKLPFREDGQQIGESCLLAVSRLHKLERQLK